jgi:DNA modification methylase
MPNLDFNGYNTLYATHGLHAYAAKCPPPLVQYGLRYYSKPNEKVMDPMMGSGTTLVEAQINGRQAVGYDIDPLACLIANVKSRKVSDAKIESTAGLLVKRVERDLTALRLAAPAKTLLDRATPPEFPNREYWFTPQVSETLSLLTWHIKHTPMPEPARDFFWVAFSSLILAKTSVANARDIIHSRHHYWQHPQPPDVLGKFKSRVGLMRKQMMDFATRCAQTQPTKAEARLGDARQLKLKAETIDLIFTSPPYATALDYTRAHFLAVAWMNDVLGVNLDEYRTTAPRYIGSERGRIIDVDALDHDLTNLDHTSAVIEQLEKSSPTYAKLTKRYFSDMRKVFLQMARVLRSRRHAIIVVCPSHIRKVEVPTHEVFVEMARGQGLRLKKQYTRTISERRRVMPYLRESFGNRMDTEYVLIFQKVV